MRIVLGVEYDGSRYHGWQAQTGLHTVQQTVEQALTKVADAPIEVFCAGRTDTGVHATNQVIHFDSNNQRAVRAWIYGANSFLPKDICIKWGKEVNNTFHARYSAHARRYRYVIYNSPIRPGLLRSYVTWQYRQLNHQWMQKASQYLLGEQDYTSFRSIECQSKTPMRSIYHIKVERKEELIIIDICANSFLHHMVRNIAGVLIMVGSGKKPLEWVEQVLLAKDRRMGAETAPPYGLYLVEVQYPADWTLPKNTLGPLFLCSSIQ